jgi:hypothetical protein
MVSTSKGSVAKVKDDGALAAKVAIASQVLKLKR